VRVRRRVAYPFPLPKSFYIRKIIPKINLHHILNIKKVQQNIFSYICGRYLILGVKKNPKIRVQRNYWKQLNVLPE
jgi:hypothetical protein